MNWLIELLKTAMMLVASPLVILPQDKATQEALKNIAVEPASGLASDNKIWVVLVVVLILFTGLTVYLWRAERRVKEVEKMLELLPEKKTST